MHIQHHVIEMFISSPDPTVQLNQLLDAMEQSRSLQDLKVLHQRVDETIMNICQGGKKQ